MDDTYMESHFQPTHCTYRLINIGTFEIYPRTYFLRFIKNSHIWKLWMFSMFNKKNMPSSLSWSSPLELPDRSTESPSSVTLSSILALWSSSENGHNPCYKFGYEDFLRISLWRLSLILLVNYPFTQWEGLFINVRNNNVTFKMSDT